MATVDFEVHQFCIKNIPSVTRFGIVLYNVCKFLHLYKKQSSENKVLKMLTERVKKDLPFER